MLIGKDTAVTAWGEYIFLVMGIYYLMPGKDTAFFLKKSSAGNNFSERGYRRSLSFSFLTV